MTAHDYEQTLRVDPPKTPYPPSFLGKLCHSLASHPPMQTEGRGTAGVNPFSLAWGTTTRSRAWIFVVDDERGPRSSLGSLMSAVSARERASLGLNIVACFSIPVLVLLFVAA